MVMSASGLADTAVARLREFGLTGKRVAVGLSGGRDSVVLLDLLAQSAPGLGIVLSAIHVHHGLSPHADAWQDSCIAHAARAGVSLTVRRVRIRRDDPAGTEAAARAARYDCYRALDVDAVALAHHADDQAETVLLQLLRGAGVPGLAAMPAARPLSANSLLVRPLLEVPGSALEDHAIARGLLWVEDESNRDERHPRNFLRHSVFPVLARGFPSYREALARVAANAADALALGRRLAALDALACETPDGLDLDQLARLDEASRANLLRHWLERQGVTVPSRVQLQEVLRQALDASPDSGLRLDVGGRILVRYRATLRTADSLDTAWSWVVPWPGEAGMGLPDGRFLVPVVSPGRGLRPEVLASGVTEVRNRRGGEKLRVDAGRPRQSLKNLLRESGVPPWERWSIPLVFIDGVLAHVPGIGTDPAFAAGPDDPGVSLRAVPADTSASTRGGAGCVLSFRAPSGPGPLEPL